MHEDIRLKILKLRTDTLSITNKYLENIYITIKHHIEDYDLTESDDEWNKGLKEIINLIYSALEEIYSYTSSTLKDIYNEVTPYDIKNIDELTYTKDDKTLTQRVTGYWDNCKALLDIDTDPDKILKYLLYHYMLILNTEGRNVEEAVKKNKKPIVQEGNYRIVVIEGCGNDCGVDCINYNGIYLEDDDIPWPPYHPNCTGIGYYDETDDLDEIEDVSADDTDLV